jgi:hypothetical protein
LKVLLIISACLLALGCAAPNDEKKDEAKETDSGPSAFVKTQAKYDFWGRELYLTNDAYSLGCIGGFGHGFMIDIAKKCTAVTSELSFVDSATQWTVTDADKTFTLVAKEIDSSRVEINGTEYMCLHHTGMTYKPTDTEKYAGDVASHTVVTMKSATKPSKLDGVHVKAIFTNDSSLCSNFK